MQTIAADTNEGAIANHPPAEAATNTDASPDDTSEIAPARNQPMLLVQTVVGNDAAILATVPVAASVVRLDPGLYAVEIDTNAIPAAVDEARPRLWLSRMPAILNEQPDLLSAAGHGDQWFETNRGVTVARATADGGWLIASVLGSLTAPNMEVSSIAELLALAGAKELAEREVPIEVIVHIERVGDRAFPGTTWAGRVGDKRRIEGFSIRPLEILAPGDIEYKALRPDGVETPWMSGTQFCGSRGQSVPLAGFAVRIVPHLQERFSVIYQAGFFNSGISGPRSNGAPCLPRIAGDQVEAINIRVVEGRNS